LTDFREGIQESIYSYDDEVNLTDGGEFLDDVIRMKDQPLGETNTIENEEVFAKRLLQATFSN
jgi:hypothetical protein